MIYDDGVPEFIPGGSGTGLPLRFAPPGLPSMFPNISDPMALSKQLDRPVRHWKRTGMSGQGYESSGWIPSETDDHMQNISSAFCQGEEGLLPDSIPDELWQTHFRQHDAELNDRKETEYLLSLYKECCGRWPVIYDRWQMHAVYGLRGKSIESLKSRFNKVVTKFIEIDVLRKKKPLSNLERVQVSQSLRLLPLFSIKYNEKNEYLRRLFLENGLKRQLPDPMQEKAVAELLRVPSLSMKKRLPRNVQMAAPGTVLASSSVVNVQTEVSSAEANRIKAMLKALGVEHLTKTPKIAKLLATIEKETHTLIMMRDALQRKKQELEILKANGQRGNKLPAPPVHNAHTVLMEAAVAAAAQQKRKR